MRQFPGIYFCFQCILLYLGQSYPEVAASVFAGNDLFRSVSSDSLSLSNDSGVKATDISGARA